MGDIQESLSNLSDSSFVILGQSSLSLDTNEESCKIPQFGSSTNNKSAHFVCESTKSETSDMCQSQSDENNLSEESIQNKLDNLVKENNQLKETLSQNNLAIKSQLDTFFMWQQEVLKTHESHKQKFLETKALILKLRAENASLKKQLGDSISGISFTNGTEIDQQVTKKPRELDSLKEKAKENEKTCNDLTEKNKEIKMENQKLKEDLKSAKVEILKLNKELEDLGRENGFLKRKNEFSKNSIESLLHKTLPNAEARTQITNLLKQLDEEKAKVFKLKEEWENVKSGNAKQSDLNAAEELNQYLDELNDINVSLDNQNQRFSSLQSWVSLAEENIKKTKVSEENLMFEINEVKTHLNQEENFSRKKQESLEELRKQFYRLLEDYKVLQQKLNSIKTKNQNIELYKKEIISLSVQIEAKDKELLLKQQECDTYKSIIKKLNLECEEVALLRVQLELYQSDFNDEQTARKKIAREKELLERTQLLQDEMQSSKKKSYTCPKCMFSFSNQGDCEDHIEDCLNILFYP